MTPIQSRTIRPMPLLIPGALSLALAGCSLFSQTPDPKTRSAVREAVPYGATSDTAASRLSGLGYACSKRQGNYTDESGHTRSAEHFLFCEQRPGVISFACQNRDLVTVVLRDDAVSGIEVVRGPSCERN
ncbi:MAG: hypothetical protein NVS9B10_30570 [Nevskia sp.]